jgi:hypothetical protein
LHFLLQELPPSEINLVFSALHECHIHAVINDGHWLFYYEQKEDMQLAEVIYNFTWAPDSDGGLICFTLPKLYLLQK